MKRILVFLGVVILLTSPVFAGVVKKSKSNVTFRGFGKFALTLTEKLTPDQKWTETNSDFKGQGIAGGLAGKTILRPGDTGEIVDLPGMTIYDLNNKKKEYTVSPIKKLTGEQAGAQAKEEPQEERERSEIKITRNEFKVQDTGETSTINNFPCKKYSVTWIMEWEDVKTGEKGSNRLDGLVWTTPYTGTLEKAREEETEFSRAYLDKIGVKVEKGDQDILGTNWLALLNAMNPEKSQARPDTSGFAGEMKKIQGYPIVVDGKYYVTGQKTETETEGKESEEKPKSIKGMFGGLAKKAIKKKPAENEAQEPALTFYTEVTEISLADFGSSDFQVPPGYKKKG
jgi:hypothetical protein